MARIRRISFLAFMGARVHDFSPARRARALTFDMGLIKLTRSQIIGYVLKCERAKQGLTQSEVGEKVGINAPMVSRYESGTAMMNVNMLWRFAGALDVLSSELVMRACDMECAFEQAGGVMVFQREAPAIEPTLCAVAMRALGFGHEEKGEGHGTEKETSKKS